MISKELEEKLRNEWMNMWHGEPKDAPQIMESCADFWLSKISSILEEERAQMIKKIEHRKRTYTYIDEPHMKGTKFTAYNKGLTDAQKLINNL